MLSANWTEGFTPELITAAAGAASTVSASAQALLDKVDKTKIHIEHDVKFDLGGVAAKFLPVALISAGLLAGTVALVGVAIRGATHRARASELGRSVRRRGR